MEQLSFAYPTYWLLACAALALAFGALLYWRDRTFREQALAWRILLFVLRAAAVFTLALLLLEPVIRRTAFDAREPVIVVAKDVSESVGAELSDDEALRVQGALEAIAGELGSALDVRYFSFGSSVRPGLQDTFSDKTTDIGSALQTIYDLYSDQNLGAVVLATDGRYNQGSNPLYVVEQLGVPVFPVLLGDSIPKKDLVLKRVFHNRIAYLGDRFQVQIDVSARGLAGAETRLRVQQLSADGRKLIEERAVPLSANDFFQTLELELEAAESGVQRYRVSLSPVAGEISRSNNYKDIFIDVLDARQQVLLLAAAPHPDLTAIRQTLLQARNFELEVAYADRFSGTLEETDFLILHGLPNGSQYGNALVERVNASGLPRLFILTGQTDIQQFNRVQGLLNIDGDGRNTNEVQALLNPAFNYFNLSEAVRNELSAFTPLIAPFGEYRAAPTASVLLYQRIGRVETRFPLLILGEQNGRRTGVLAAEGIWKWRLFDYLQHENHELFNELLGKTVQYVSLKEDKRRFRVSLPKNLFPETESISFNAELYNESLELINEPDVLLTIYDAEGNDFAFTFDKKGATYSLDAGQFPVGTYRYEANTIFNGQVFEAAGQFSVEPIQLELFETTADFGSLRLLAERTGGTAFSPGELTGLPALLKELPGLKPVLYSSVETYPLLNLKWIFALLLALFTLEWFLRRYFGAY